MIKKIAMCIGWLLFLGILGACWMFTRNVEASGVGDLKILNLQSETDADCTILFQEDVAVMIDAGTEADSQYILETLEMYGIEKLDYLILTHGDLDHIGAVEHIAEQIEIENVIQSGYEEAGEELLYLNDCFKKHHIPVSYPARTVRINVGQMQLVVYPPLEKHYNDNDNYSLVVLVTHKKVNMLFTGDAIRKRSEELLLVHWPEIDYYKVPNHGRANSMSETLFNKMSPVYAVITSDTADQIVIDAADKNSTELFYTGKGDCLFVSDGNKILPMDVFGEKGGK